MARRDRARRFGAKLFQQFLIDHARGRQPHLALIGLDGQLGVRSLYAIDSAGVEAEIAQDALHFLHDGIAETGRRRGYRLRGRSIWIVVCGSQLFRTPLVTKVSNARVTKSGPVWACG